MNDSINKHICALERCYTYLFTKKNSLGHIKYIEELHNRAQSIVSITSKLIKQEESNNSTILPQKQIYDLKTVYSDKHIKACYVCRRSIHTQHNHYTHMCMLCGHINWHKRIATKKMKGVNAVVTGGRIKIGFETATRLLRCGCNVIISTRFADDALERYKAEPDFEDWKERLYIVQVNFLTIASTKKFIQFVMSTFTTLDILINNAAQTIKRVAEFYKNEMTKQIDDTDNNIKLLIDTDLRIESIKDEYLRQVENTIPDTTSNIVLDTSDTNKEMSLVALAAHKDDIKDVTKYTEYVQKIFPEGKLDEFGQQMDMSPVNSWVLEIGDIDIRECAEVHLINSITPFTLISALIPIMKRQGDHFSWIINVSSMEGCFNRKKSACHPHTNMAKASLNMMSRTAAGTLIKDHIVLCSVDTGWNNNQMPKGYDAKTPVDCVDGAARILDPIFRELKKPGVFYKDFMEHDW